jgi:hypothetical protein
MRHQHDVGGRRVDLRVVQRAPQSHSPRDGGDGGDGNRNGYPRRPQDAYDGIHPTYMPGLPIHTALRHPSRSPGCPHMLRLLMIMVCACACLMVVVIGTMTMAVMMPFGGEVGNERLLGELRTGAMRRAVSSLSGRGVVHPPAMGPVAVPRPPAPRPPRPPPPSPSPPSPSPPPSPPPEALADELWRREPALTRTPEELLDALDELAATTGDDDSFSTGFDWGRAMVSLPEWRQDGTADELDERAALGDLVRLVHHMHRVVRAQRDELRNVTRAVTIRRRARGVGGPRVESHPPRRDAAHNRTANVSVRVLK